NCLYRCRSQTKIVAHNIYIALWTAKINLHIDTHECCPGRIKLDISLITKTRAVLNLYFEEITLWGTIQPSWKSESVCFFEFFVILLYFIEYLFSGCRNKVFIRRCGVNLSYAI